MSTRPSQRAAINAKCKECVYDPIQRGNWREQVAACASSACPLFAVRPVPKSCMSNGCIDPAGVNSVVSKLEQAEAA